MRRAKAIGLIGKIPGGRIPGRRRGEPIEISRARAMIRDEIKGLPALADRPLAELEPAELLDALTPKALCKLGEILDLPTDLDALGGDMLMQHRRYCLQANVAQSITATRAKIDEASLRHVEHTDKIGVLMEKLRNVKMPEE
jgi:hypothetical protein